ncbi:branched-chain amino acid ABC transporter substrate-binding protein [Hahella sp. SMD15-11]|uniref:Branched-chain amino acid ABC transporter substrate-binding protein n=1 Tax=Thermohahella caldifontis TaxID=3142973 RepID=A0AB39URU5_9GAMM
MKKTFARNVLSLSASVMLMGATAITHADTIQIAIAGPVTGPVAQYGDMQIIGAKMAVEQINKAGGVNGDTLEAVVMDDACDPKQAVAVANKVVNEGIRFVVGHLCSSSTQPASDVYEDEGVLMITPASTNPEITQRGYKYIFRTIGLDSDQGPTAGNFIASKIKPKRVAVLHDKQQYGEGIASSVKKTLEEKGIKVVMFEGITAGDKDFSALIAKMKQADVDFVYYGGYHPELGLILRQSREKGFKAQFMGPEGVGNKDLSAIAGEASEGLLVTLPPAFDLRPENKALVEAFKAKGQDPSGAFVMTSYAAVKVMADAIAATKTTDTDVLQKYIHTHSFNTPMGEISFQENGDLKGFQFDIYTWHADGTKTPVKM